MYFQMTITANRRHHTRNLVHGKLAADETSNHCVTRHSECSVKIIKTTINIASRRSPNIRQIFVGRAVGSERSAVFNQLDWKRIFIFFSFTIRYERVSITAENVVMQLIDLFPFLGSVNQAVCGQHKHTGQTTWRYNPSLAFVTYQKSSKLKKKILWHNPSAILK